jgi:hypothetical protein
MDSISLARRFFLKRISRYGLSLALLAGAKPAFAKPTTTLTGIRISQSADDHTRVVFDLSGGFEHRLFTLADPHRIVIDLTDTRKSQAIEIDNVSTNLMSGLRSASKGDDRLRVVLDLEGKVRPRSFACHQPEPDTDKNQSAGAQQGQAKVRHCTRSGAWRS